jgi:cell division transport system permease protein
VIARKVAARAAQLAGIGGVAGALLALPALAGLAALAAPIGGAEAMGLEAMPWFALAAVPVAAWLIGWVTAEVSVRVWLRRLP